MGTKTLNYTITACGLSDVGLVRENNEDVCSVDCKEKIFLLADGMGGHSAGEVAARQAVDHLNDLIKKRLGKGSQKKSLAKIRTIIQELISEVNLSVYQTSLTDSTLRGMGSTLCCVYFHDECFVLAHVGDSRIYLLRDNQLRQLTQDHSLVAELMELGELNDRQAREYTHRNIITKAIGTESKIDPTMADCDFLVGDQVLMCSDGLTDHLALEEIENILNKSSSIEGSAQKMIDAANGRGGHDNITVVLMKVQHGSEDPDLS